VRTASKVAFGIAAVRFVAIAENGEEAAFKNPSMRSDEVSTSVSPLIRPFSELALVGGRVVPSSTRNHRRE
jgi:hypothetical protein